MKNPLKKTLLTTALFALSFQSYAEAPLKTVEQKASYTLGVDLAKNFEKQGIQIDADALILGFQDGLKKQPLKLTQQEMNESIQAFKKQIMAQKLAEHQALAAKNLKKGEQFLAENKKKPGVKTLPDGLQYRIIKPGKGTPPTDGSTVIAHYEGRTIDGKVFDSSYKRGTPLKFELNNVIQGWQEALKMMKPGAVWEIYIPAKLAYGEKGAGNVIGPNETLIFKVELLSVLPPKDAPKK